MDDKVTTKDLRNFGLIVGGIFALIAVWPLVIRGEAIKLWAAGAAVVLVGPALVAPQILKPVHRVWMKIGHALGWINTKILLGIVFYGIVTPLGWIGRLLGKDYMRLRLKESVETYRHPKVSRPADHMRHPF